MNQAPESGRLGRWRSAEETSHDSHPSPSTNSAATAPDSDRPSAPKLQPTEYSPTTSTAGKVRRRRKKRQPRTDNQGSDSDSDNMEPDPEVGSSGIQLQDDMDQERTRSTNSCSSVIEVQETPAGGNQEPSVIEAKETTALQDEDQISEAEEKTSQTGGNESDLDFAHLRQHADELAHKFVQKVKDVTWKVTHHNYLPDWLKDNDFLHYHHRPPLPSFRTCFKSIFRIHTETGNIWTHLIGCLAFIIIAIIFLVRSIMSREEWQEIVAYMMFFLGAILCLGFSCLFHTLYCHSHKVSKIFSKLDYSGITFLIVGSFVPWLHFGFYCENITRWVYLVLITSLGSVCLFVCLRDTFSLPKYRPLRAGLYVALGLSGVIPAIHYVSINSFLTAIQGGGLGWMILMACLYIGGAALYAVRIPERFFPGKCDVWFQSHQIFHVLVLAAAFVHYHGINTMAAYRDQIGECDAQETTELPSTTVVV